MQNSPITNQTIENLAKNWLDFIKYREIGFYQWPPKSNASRRIIQFLNDKSLQESSDIDTNKTIFLFLDLNDEAEVDNAYLQSIISNELTRAMNEKSIERVVSDPLVTLKQLESENYLIIFLISGINQLIFKEDLAVFKEIAGIHERVKNSSVLFFCSTYLTPVFKNKLLDKNVLAANYFYKSVYSPADSDAFLTYFAAQWKIKITTEQKDWILKQCSGRLGLIKNALRLIRATPQISPEELMTNSSMLGRAKSILECLPIETKKRLIKITKNDYSLQAEDKDFIDYALSTGFLVIEKDKYIFHPPFLNTISLDNPSQNLPGNLDLILSAQEKRVYTYLFNNMNKIISRQILGEYIWESDTDEFYSDWAIDQLMHKIREKLKQSNSPYQIITKKGQGFIMVNDK